MFFGVLNFTYHTSITIDSPTCGVTFSTLRYACRERIIGERSASLRTKVQMNRSAFPLVHRVCVASRRVPQLLARR
jgi:hypothetical protein